MKILYEEKGSTIVLVSIMATVLLALTAIVVDYGLLTIQVKRMEYNTDAAALAGAQELPQKELAITKAKQFSGKNGLDLNQTFIDVSEDNKTVGVMTYKEQPLSFARILNKDMALLQAQSRATLSPISKMWGAVPLGIDNRTLKFGDYVSLKVAPDNDTDYLLGSGNYGILALSGPGTSDYENDLKFGFKSWLKIGNIVPLQSGNISGATKKGVEYRVSQCNHIPKCTPSSFQRDCPLILTVPVYEINSMTGTNQVKDIKIVGFAAFFLDSYTSTGKDNYVNGYFVRKIEPGEYSELVSDYGINVVHLTKW